MVKVVVVVPTPTEDKQKFERKNGYFLPKMPVKNKAILSSQPASQPYRRAIGAN